MISKHTTCMHHSKKKKGQSYVRQRTCGLVLIPNGLSLSYQSAFTQYHLSTRARRIIYIVIPLIFVIHTLTISDIVHIIYTFRVDGFWLSRGCGFSHDSLGIIARDYIWTTCHRCVSTVRGYMCVCTRYRNSAFHSSTHHNTYCQKLLIQPHKNSDVFSEASKLEHLMAIILVLPKNGLKKSLLHLTWYLKWHYGLLDNSYALQILFQGPA